MEMLELNIYATTGCDTGCGHCSQNSSMQNQVHFTPELAEKLISDLDKKNQEVVFIITGGGEPLLNPYIVEILDIFIQYDGTDTIHLITSGFLEKEVLRKKRLGEIIGLNKSKEKLIIHQSFNLYHPSFSERLQNMTSFMLENRLQSSVFTETCISIENAEDTLSTEKSILKALALKNGYSFYALPINQVLGESKFPLDSSAPIRFETLCFLYTKAYLSNTYYVIKKPSGGEGLVVFSMPKPLEKSGRGKYLPDSGLARVVCTPMLDSDDSSLIIAPDGSVYPDCGCYPEELMRLGKLGVDNIFDMIDKKLEFSSQIFRRFLANKKLCQFETDEVCLICKQMIAERGLIV